MVKLSKQNLTLEEFLRLPETKPASEYINGQIIQKPMPQGKHSTIQGELVTSINTIAKEKKIAKAFPELRCTFGGRSIVPDIAVFSWERIPVDENGDVANVFAAAPDWTIEILSPDQSPTKVIGNILHCLTHNCKFGWLITPDERSVIVYPLGKQPIYFEKASDLLPVPEFLELQLKVEDLFNWLKI
ncbi:Uma2 family endonuclease [Gloeocapsopsis dulcis]|uniref:Putative restriction endonuclease domain-containing protein n=1 Tax=Gloeocapsopsis dulcis AAB1 = 1H9 TaxID=1433147 RepID=A0A6N8FN58_9CHRO|nr:Uma2 family endonuclease [Gloeocapsopsis dulcis]MUL34918.1 hypothetical protein [Gloeocapsopsis dulcis AAB1 = 1H9]WNN90010.1 Uma2 family endonuclease [Gloeocapsopsis dulcis]